MWLKEWFDDPDYKLVIRKAPYGNSFRMGLYLDISIGSGNEKFLGYIDQDDIDFLVEEEKAKVAARKEAFEKKQAAKAEANAAFGKWLNSLPEEIAGLKREDDALTDDWGNAYFYLTDNQLKFKSVNEIENHIASMMDAMME